MTNYQPLMKELSEMSQQLPAKQESTKLKRPKEKTMNNPKNLEWLFNKFQTFEEHKRKRAFKHDPYSWERARIVAEANAWGLAKDLVNMFLKGE